MGARRGAATIAVRINPIRSVLMNAPLENARERLGHAAPDPPILARRCRPIPRAIMPSGARNPSGARGSIVTTAAQANQIPGVLTAVPTIVVTANRILGVLTSVPPGNAPPDSVREKPGQPARAQAILATILGTKGLPRDE